MTDTPRGPGRPTVGRPVHVRLGDLYEPVHAWAREHGTSAAEAVRRLVARGLDAEPPDRSDLHREDT